MVDEVNSTPASTTPVTESVEQPTNTVAPAPTPTDTVSLFSTQPDTVTLFNKTLDILPEVTAANGVANFALVGASDPTQPMSYNQALLTMGDDTSERKIMRQTAASNILLSNMPVEEKIPTAKSELTKPIVPSSVGNFYASRNFGEEHHEVGDALDTAALVEDDQKAMLNFMGRDPSTDYNTVVNESAPEYTDVINSINSYLGNNPNTSEAVKELARNTSSTLLGIPLPFGLERPKTPIDRALDVLDLETSALQDKALDIAGVRKDATLKDVLEYTSMIPLDAKAEVDIKNAVKIVFSTENLQERSDRLETWNAEFQRKYGEGAYWQLAAFMAKEGIIEGVPLAVALANPKSRGKLVASQGANLLTRIGYAMRRAAFVGVTGGTTQAAINTYIGGEGMAVQESTIRAVGSLAAEAVLSAGGTGGKVVGGLLKGVVAKAVQGGKTVAPDTVVSSVSGYALDAAIQALSPSNAQIQRIPGKLGTVKPKTVTEAIAGAVDSTDKTGEMVRLGSTINNQMAATGRVPTLMSLRSSEVESAMSGVIKPTTIEEEILQRGMGARIIGDKVTRQKNVDNILDYYLDNKVRALTYRPDAYRGDSSILGMKSLLADPESFVGAQAKDYFDAYNLQNAYLAAITKATDAATSGLGKADTRAVWQVRQEVESLLAKNPDKKLTELDLRQYGLNDDQVDSFYAIEKVSNYAARLVDGMTVKAAREAGHMSYQGKLVRIVEDVDSERAVVKEITNTTSRSPFEGTVNKAELEEVKRVIGYIPSFVPRRVKDAKYHISVIDPSSGTIHRTHAFSSLSDTLQELKRVEEAAADSGLIPFYDRWDETSSIMQFGAGQNGRRVVDTLDEKGVENIRNAIINSGRSDIEVDNLLLAFDNTAYGGVINKKLAGSRSANGLLSVDGKKATYLPANEAFLDYLQSASATVMRDFRRHSITKFQDEFKDVLDYRLPWTQDIKRIAGKEDLVDRAKSVQAYLRRSFEGNTSFGRAFTNSTESLLGRLANGNTVQRGFGKFLDHAPIVKTMFTDSRGGSALIRRTTSRIIFSFNVGSFLTQTASSVALNVGARLSKPLSIATGITDMARSLMAKGTYEATQGATKEGATALRALRRSGYLSEVEITDLADALTGTSSKFDKYAMFPIRAGETANRALSFYMARADMKELFKEGKLLGIDGLKFKGKVDDDEFTRIVLDKAKELGLNMSKTGQVKALSGPGSVLLQYWQAPVKTARVIFGGSNLSASERVGAAFGLVAMGGTAAIPFSGDILWGADNMGWAATGEDDLRNRQLATATARSLGDHILNTIEDMTDLSKEDADFLRKATKEGGIAALTDSEVALYNRLAMDNLVQNFHQMISTDPVNSFPAIAISTKIVNESKNITDYFENWYTAQSIIDARQNGLDFTVHPDKAKAESTAAFISNVLNSAGRVSPGIGWAADILNNHPDSRAYLNPQLEGNDTGRFLTRNRQQIGNEPVDTTDLLNLSVGLMPKERREAITISNNEREWAGALDDMQQTFNQRYKNATTPEAKWRVMQETFKQAQIAEKVLMSGYEGALRSAAGGNPSKPYKVGSLWNKWQSRFRSIDRDYIYGKSTRSIGGAVNDAAE